MTEAIIHGIVLAFGLILPLGIQNIFVFNQGAAGQKLRQWLPVVVTAALCDTLLIGIAVGGISLVLLSSVWLVRIIYGSGIVFLAFMGWKIWGASPAAEQTAELSVRRQIAFALSVSLLNPHAIMDTVGVIGVNSLQYDGSDRWLFAAAAAAVSWVWFFALACTGRLLGRADPSGVIVRLLNKASALLIWGVAVYMAVQLWQELR